MMAGMEGKRIKGRIYTKRSNLQIVDLESEDLRWDIGRQGSYTAPL